MQRYFWIECSEDGDVHIINHDRVSILQEIQERGDSVLHSAVLPDRDPQTWGSAIVIIKGAIVTPQAKEKVVNYEIE